MPIVVVNDHVRPYIVSDPKGSYKHGRMIYINVGRDGDTLQLHNRQFLVALFFADLHHPYPPSK